VEVPPVVVVAAVEVEADTLPGDMCTSVDDARTITTWEPAPRIAPEPIWDQSALAPLLPYLKWRCPLSKVIACSRKGNHQKGIGIKIRCREYRCPTCFHWVRHTWCQHIRAKIRTTTTDDGLDVREFHWRLAPSSETRSAKNRIGINRGHFVRVTSDAGDLIVSSVPFARSSPIPARQAWDKFVAAVLGLKQPSNKKGTRHQPIVASRKWKLPQRGTGTHRKDAIFGDEKAAHEIFMRMGSTVVGYDDGHQAYVYDHPPTWTADEVRWASIWADACTFPLDWDDEEQRPSDPRNYIDLLMAAAEEMVTPIWAE
jgi:hypothetical protein